MSLAPLISALGGLPNISMLRLQVWDAAPSILPTLAPRSVLSLAKSASLRDLHLEGFQVQGSDVDAFRRGLATNTTLSKVRFVNCWINHLMFNAVQPEWRAFSRTMFEQYSLQEFEVSLNDRNCIHPCYDAVLERIQWMCRLNAASRGRAMDGTISRGDLVDLLAVANSDLDVTWNILIKCPMDRLQ
jgi:hypothetical protein